MRRFAGTRHPLEALITDTRPLSAKEDEARVMTPYPVFGLDTGHYLGSCREGPRRRALPTAVGQRPFQAPSGG